MAKTKRGRKPNHFTAADGTPIVGLARRPSDGRWRVIATGETFTEHDEAKAIERFMAMTGQRQEQIERQMRQLANRNVHAIYSFTEAELWQHVADQIRQRPQWVAQQTGIEHIGYLADLQPPEPLPSFTELERAWQEHAETKPEERRKVLKAWRTFTSGAGVKGLTDINKQAVVAFRDKVKASDLSPKTQRHLFSKARRLLTFCQKERAMAPEAIGKALEAMKALTVKAGAVELNPCPIAKADFHKLLNAATGDDRALLLLMLNCGLYLQEAIDLTWDNIHQGKFLIAHRRKKNRVVRVAVLWAETIEALEAITRKGDSLFVSQYGTRLGVKGAQKRWQATAEKAGLWKAVTASQLRDGAATVATEAGINPEFINLLLGHRTGMRDHYVKRNPAMVKPACDAVYAAYMA